MKHTLTQMRHFTRKVCSIVLVGLLTAAQAFTQLISSPPAGDVDTRIETILNQMTLEEKIDLIGRGRFLHPRRAANQIPAVEDG